MKTNLLSIFFCCFILILTAQNNDFYFPPNNYVSDTSSITIKWNNADSVALEISTVKSFSSVSAYNIYGNSSITLNNLNFQKYFWRIKTTTNTTWQKIDSFTINDNNLNNLDFHLDPNQLVDLNGNKVTQWIDLQNDLSFTQPNTALQPSIQYGLINNNNILEFGNNQNYLSTSNDYLLPNDFTINIVYKNNLKTLAGYFLSNDIDVGVWLGCSYQNRGIGIYDGIDDAFWQTNTYSYDWTLISLTKDSLFINGVFVATNGGLGDKTLESFTINKVGACLAYSGTHFSGYSGDILIFNQTLNDSTRNLVEDYLKWKYTPIPNFGNDTVVCAAELVLKVPSDHGYSQITWSNGQTNVDSITATTSGTYWVQVKSFGLTLTDTIEISLSDKPQLSFQNDTISCVENNLFLSYTNLGSFEYTWSNGSSADTLFNISSGTYFIAQNDTANGCIINSDAVNIQIDSFSLQSTLGPDRTFCLGSNLELQTTSTNNEPYAYNWSTLDTTSFIVLNTPASTTLSVAVTDAFRCTARDTITANVLNLASPSVDFIADTVCFNTASSFLSTAVASGADLINNYIWSFPDHSTLTGSNSVQYTHFNNTTYQVNLSVQTDSNCENSITKPVYLRKLPVVNFNQEIVCADQATAFTENSYTFFPDAILNYNWFINGALASASENPSLNFNAIGKQELKLVVASELGCFNELIDSIEVFPALNADFSFTNNCIGDSIIFTDQTASFSVVDWNWNFGTFQNANIQNPKAFFTAIGAQQVKLDIENAIGCKSSITKTIDIKAQPEASFAFDKACLDDFSLFYSNSIAPNDPISTLKWQIDTSLYTGDSVSHLFTALQNYPVSLNIETASGCQDDTAVLVSVHQNPNPAFSFSPNYGTAPLEVVFENTTPDAFTYAWNFGDSTGISTDQNPTYTYQQNGIYNISLNATNQFNCSAAAEKQIAVIASELDLALKNLSFEIQENTDESISIKPKLEIRNVGTRKITNADLVLKLNDDNSYVQYWQNEIAAGGAVNHSFTGYFLVPNLAETKYICIEAINVNDGTEKNFENNKVCKVLDGLIQFSKPYPNPASTSVNIDLITKDKGTCSIQVFNALGEKVTPLKAIELVTGYNKIQISTAVFQSGKYFVQVKYLDESYLETFMLR